MPPKQKEELSDTDRQQLEELLSEREFEARLRARRKAQFESVKVWAQWLAAAALGASIVKDAAAWALSRLKEWLA